MNSTNRIINILLCLSLVVMAGTSCKKWLDVKPKTEIETSDLFADERGFKEALAGVYTGMADSTLYTRNLSFGLLDAMAQYWNIPGIYAEYHDATLYNYESDRIKPAIDAVWNGLYNVIANANNILDQIDAKKELFKDNNYAIIKGEALAIRAYAHFDLLRMFAPADFSGAALSIPYVTSFSKQISRQYTPQEVIGLCVKDLEDAAELLKADPVYTQEEVTLETDNGYLLNRNYHLNYYAVKGLQARVYLYSGAKAKALEAAQEVIQAHDQKGLFQWVKTSDVTIAQKNLRDRTFSSEHLFALNSKRLAEIIVPYFKSGNTLLISREPVKSVIYENLPDYRSEYLFETVNSTPDILTKLWQEDGAPKKGRMPMIRLSEMYYIAAECNSNNAEVAVEYLNEVRRHRGLEVDLPATLNEPELTNEIYKEYKKEFIGEGQLYFYHKRRKDVNIGNVRANYIFPMPDVEIEFGNRK